ncbi:MAG: DMT family transporter [Ignavibacteriaceae bacterium]
MTFTEIKKHSAFPVILLLALSLIWGSSFILIKKGLNSFTPAQVGTIRIFFAFLVLLPFAFKYLKSIFKNSWKKILFLGIIANLIPAVLFAAAETGLSSSMTGVLNALTPMMTLIIGAAAFKTSIQKKQALGLIIAFAGSITLSFVNTNGQLESFNSYSLYVIAATICYGIGLNMVRVNFLGVKSIALSSLTMFSIGPISLVYLLCTDFVFRLTNLEGSWISLGYIFLLGAVGTGFALILFNRLIQTTSAVMASSVTYLIPIIAVAWGVIDGEQIFILHIAAMVLIILGVYIVNKSKNLPRI